MGRRLALLIATSRYQDEGLRQVATTATADVEALAGVLRDPNVGGFEVSMLVDEPHERVGAAIDELYRARDHDDLTLLYVSGHALVDAGGQLNFATADTQRGDLAGTGVPASRVQGAMAASAARTVLVLDCGYGAVTGPGYPAQVGAAVGVLQRFGGPGREVLTASDTVQCVFEGDRLHGTAMGSVFTRHLVEGLWNGSADLDELVARNVRPWAALEPTGPPTTVVAGQVPPPLPPPPTSPPPPGFAQPAWPGAAPPAPPSPWASPTRLGILAAVVVLMVVVAAVVLTGGSGDEASSAGRETPDLTIRTDPTETTEPTVTTETTAPAETNGITSEDPRITAAGAIGTADPSCQAETDGVLRIGELLPETGDLAFLYPPMSAGAAIAVQEVNAAGGVLGRPVEYLPGDSGDESPDLAGATVDRHLQSGADMILGAAASGISLDVIDTVTGDCTVQFSPSNTSTAFLDYDDDDLYFRTAPSDVLQGKVIADTAIADGVTSMAVLYRQDSYGRGLDVFFRTFYGEQGGRIVADRGYDPESPDYSAEVNEVLAANPEGLVLIGFDESADILQGLFAQGFTPDQKHIYLVDGNTGNALGEDFAAGALDGVTGTYTASELTDAFYQQMLDQDPALIDFLYGPETYDAVVITARAAESAGTDRADEIARRINGVTRDGTECAGFVECRDLLAAGEDIDYTGLSGPLEFSQPGEPTTASFAVETFGPDNELDPDRTEFVFATL